VPARRCRRSRVDHDGQRQDGRGAPGPGTASNDALASFDARTEIGVLGVQGRADTVEELSELMRDRGVQPVRWYGVWLFVDWLEFGGAALDPSDAQQVAATAAVELEASRRDPYRQLSRVFHLVGRKGPN
jgi:S-adenosylmethionine-dependent methyltransferase